MCGFLKIPFWGTLEVKEQLISLNGIQWFGSWVAQGQLQPAAFRGALSPNFFPLSFPSLSVSKDQLLRVAGHWRETIWLQENGLDCHFLARAGPGESLVLSPEVICYACSINGKEKKKKSNHTHTKPFPNLWMAYSKQHIIQNLCYSPAEKNVLLIKISETVRFVVSFWLLNEGLVSCVLN